jgi:hypothetical protein
VTGNHLSVTLALSGIDGRQHFSSMPTDDGVNINGAILASDGGWSVQ